MVSTSLAKAGSDEIRSLRWCICTFSLLANCRTRIATCGNGEGADAPGYIAHIGLRRSSCTAGASNHRIKGQKSMARPVRGKALVSDSLIR